MKKASKKWLIISLVSVISLILIGTAVIYALGIPDALAAYRLLDDVSKKTVLNMVLTVHARSGDAQTAIELPVHYENAITTVEIWGTPLYCRGNQLYLENGKAFTLTEGQTDYTKLFSEAALLYRGTKIDKEKLNDETLYRISVPGDQALDLTTMIAGTVDPVELTLTEKDNTLTALTLSFTATAGGTLTEVTARLDISADTSTHPIPQPVLDAIAAGPDPNAAPLTDALLRLIAAWKDLSSRDTTGTDLTLSANLGIMNLEQQLEFYRTRVNGKDLYCIGKNGQYLYLDREKVLNPESASLETGLALLPPILYQLMLNSTTSYSRSGDLHSYTLTLSQEDMASIVHALAPQTEQMNITYLAGSVEIRVEDTTLRTISITCEGELLLLLTTLPVSLSAELAVLESAQITVPEDILAKLG